MNGQVTSRTGAIVICAAVTVIASTVARGLWINENPPPHVLTAAECTSCHSDPASLRRMKLKEGNLHIFFHGPDITHLKLDPGSPYPAGSGWAPK
jgi:hypothetical protein